MSHMADDVSQAQEHLRKMLGEWRADLDRRVAALCEATEEELLLATIEGDAAAVAEIRRRCELLKPHLRLVTDSYESTD